MNEKNEPELTPEFLRAQLKAMANLELSEDAAGRHELITGLVAMMNTLEVPVVGEGVPALTFRPIKE